MTASTEKPLGLQSTRETWSLAIKYVSDRKRIEEALGFSIRLGDIVANTADLNEIIAALRRVSVPYLADIAIFEFADGRPAQMQTNLGSGVEPELAQRVRAVCDAALVEGASDQVRTSNNISLAALGAVASTAIRLKAEGAMIQLPISYRGQRFGQVLLIKCTDDVPKYSLAHVAMARELARALGTALFIAGQGALPA